MNGVAIVEAVATASGRTDMANGDVGKSPLASLIEAAMSKAVTDCYEAGVTDPDEVRAKMLDAREAVKQRYADAVAKALAEGNLER